MIGPSCHRRWLANLSLWVALASGCGRGLGCGAHEAVLATVTAVSGGVLQIDDYAAPIAWQSIGVGAQARAGDALRTDQHAIASVRLLDHSEVTLQPASLLRFRPSQSGAEPEFDLLSGEAYVHAHDKDLPLYTTVGVAHLRPGAQLQLKRSGGALHVQLRVGEATFRTADGSDVVLAKGDTLRLEIGAAIIRETEDGLAGEVQAPDPLVQAQGLLLDVPQGGVRARAPADKTWRSVPTGTSPLLPGTRLSVAPGSRAVLRRADDTVELFGAGDYRVTAEGPLVTANRGKVHVQTQSQDILIVVPGGWIKARAANGGSEAELVVDDNSAHLEVQRGQVTWSAGEDERQIAPGQPLSWTLPGAADNGDARAQAGEHDSTPDSRMPAPERASFIVPAGESFVVHAAELPVALGLSLGSSCKGEALVELNNGAARYRGSEVVKVWLDAGTRTYSARCADKPSRSSLRGHVRVLQDAGTRKLPARPPTSNVDADGRGYTIYYQNQPPDIRVRWPNAPDTKLYQLDVDGDVLKLSAPEHTFPSGKLSDGQHRLTFSALSRRSRTTSVEVRFDNTAATASLNAPQDRGFSAGAEVEIDGVVLPAWKVSVEGGTIEKVGDSRFHGRIVTSQSNPDFAVRLSHRRLGTHYYVRRAADTP